MPLIHAATGRGRGGSGGSGGTRQQRGRRQQDEDVELFSIDSGWNVEVLEEVGDLLGADGLGWTVDAAAPASASASSSRAGASSAGGSGLGSDDDGWSVETVAGSSSSSNRGAGSDDELWEEGDYDDAWLDEDWDAAAASASRRGQQGAAAPAVFSGRVLGQAEQQVLASLPRHMIRRLEAEQREADEGGAGRGGVGCDWQVGVWACVCLCPLGLEGGPGEGRERVRCTLDSGVKVLVGRGVRGWAVQCWAQLPAA